MPRSAAAIARRAGKRGRSIEEQAKADALAARKEVKIRVDKLPSFPEKEGGSVEEKPSCQLKRRKRSPAAIARREAKRKALHVGLETETAAPLVAVGSSSNTKTGKTKKPTVKPAREVWTCSQCGLEGIWGTRFRCRECGEPRYNRKKMDRSWIDPKVAGGWKIERPTAQKLADNSRLRDMYKQNPDSMSEEDRKRAEILIRRSERKRQKKAKARAAFLDRKAASSNKGSYKKRHVNLNLPSSMDR